MLENREEKFLLLFTAVPILSLVSVIGVKTLKFSGKTFIQIYLVETDSDPDRQALDAVPYPDPPKVRRSDRLGVGSTKINLFSIFCVPGASLRM
jgi:hypothetical protein